MHNQRIVLARRPVGEPTPQDFRLETVETPAPARGEVLVRTQFLSLDPYMRGRMNTTKSYAPPIELGDIMVGGTVGEIVESNDGGFSPGDIVLANGGWQRYAVCNARELRKLGPRRFPLTYALGVLGMPGQTAYCALLDIGAPKRGETLVVSAASGAVGSVAGQIGKIFGCRVIGIAGTDDKCAYVVQELGFDASINRRTQDLDEALADTCPDGIDIYYDNTAGAILEAVLRRINLGARIPLVGLIEHYNATQAPHGPFLAPLLTQRAKIEGFLVTDHAAHVARFLGDMHDWLAKGQVRYREDIVDGLENAPRAFIGLLRGENFGKLLVRVG
ncbi:MAG: NADP-dependent oxidoreductase [Vulcanimicrobiaceae bacterium]